MSRSADTGRTTPTPRAFWASRGAIAYRAANGGPLIQRDDQVVFQSSLLTIGVFDARPEDPHFHDSGRPGEHLVVFPLTSVRLQPESSGSFVADRNVATYYNPDQAYRRSAVSHLGDRAHWFALEPGAFEEILGELGGRVASRGEGLFPFLYGPTESESFQEQLGLVRDLTEDRLSGTLEVEERAFALLRRVAANACAAKGWQGRSPGGRSRPWAERARELLAARYAEDLSVADIATMLGCSPYHLCRVFRRDTGLTLHGYREQLRLRRALLEIDNRRGDLTGLALDLGYSSHSHFTAAFRGAFGQVPSKTVAGT